MQYFTIQITSQFIDIKFQLFSHGNEIEFVTDEQIPFGKGRLNWRVRARRRRSWRGGADAGQGCGGCATRRNPLAAVNSI